MNVNVSVGSEATALSVLAFDIGYYSFMAIMIWTATASTTRKSVVRIDDSLSTDF